MSVSLENICFKYLSLKFFILGCMCMYVQDCLLELFISFYPTCYQVELRSSGFIYWTTLINSNIYYILCVCLEHYTFCELATYKHTINYYQLQICICGIRKSCFIYNYTSVLVNHSIFILPPRNISYSVPNTSLCFNIIISTSYFLHIKEIM